MEPQIISAFHPGLGRMVPVKEAANGLACGCFCTLCGKELIAVQGSPAWHYRHYRVSACPGGPMTEVHSRAVSLLLAQNRLTVGRDTIIYDQLGVQQKAGRFLPDVTAIANGEKLFLEVMVTHACEASKITYYRENQCASIEIDLSYLPYDADDATLYRELFLNGGNKTWIYRRPAVSPPPSRNFSFPIDQAVMGLLGLIALCGIALYWLIRGRQRKRRYSFSVPPKKSYWR